MPPSRHLASLAGLDLVSVSPPVVRAEAAREVAVVLSRGRVAGQELFLERCWRDRVPIVIRPSGGGAVVLAPGVVAASVLDHADPNQRFPEAYFRRFCAQVREALKACDVAGMRLRGTSDLCIGERKVAGSSLRLWQGRVLFQVAVLVDADVALLERYLRMPSRQPPYRQGRSHREFVTTLAREGHTVRAEEVAAALATTFAAGLARLG
ncbi:MAG: biotin/lipoate A/B protein ligase family protein [Thermoanaerobaculales bacterium]